MRGIRTIRTMNHEAVVRALEADKRPFRLEPGDAGDIRANRRVPFPRTGYEVPEGLKLVRVMLCDLTGFGDGSESVLTLPELTDHLVVGRYYGVIETEQFLAHVGEFVEEDEEVDVDLTPTGAVGPERVLAEIERMQDHDAEEANSPRQPGT